MGVDHSLRYFRYRELEPNISTHLFKGYSIHSYWIQRETMMRGGSMECIDLKT